MRRVTKEGRQPEFISDWKSKYYETTKHGATYKALQKDHDMYLSLRLYWMKRLSLIT